MPRIPSQGASRGKRRESVLRHPVRSNELNVQTKGFLVRSRRELSYFCGLRDTRRLTQVLQIRSRMHQVPMSRMRLHPPRQIHRHTVRAGHVLRYAIGMVVESLRNCPLHVPSTTRHA